LTAPDQVEQAELAQAQLPQLIKQLALSYDAVIINTSAYWTVGQAELARCCTGLLFLMDQRMTSIKACQRVMELCIKLQIPEARFHFALNGCHKFAPISAQDAMLALGGQLVSTILDGGTLVDELLSLGYPWELLKADNHFVASMQELLLQLLPPGGREVKPGTGERQSHKPFGLAAIFKMFKTGDRDVA
jgi:pilus assembly protein CpaE